MTAPMRWQYLETEAFRMRSAMAAWWLRECETIIDIGGGATPITDFLLPHQRSIVIDPLVPPTSNPAAIHLPIRVQDWDAKVPEPFGVVMLGCDLDGFDHWIRHLCAIIAKASRTVLEAPSHYKPSMRQIRDIIRRTTCPVLATIQMSIEDMTARPYVWPRDGWPPKPDRYMVLLGKAHHAAGPS